MQVDAEELVHQFQQDWPAEYERSALRLMVAKLSAENDALKAAQDTNVFRPSPRGYTSTSGNEGGHHAD